MYSVELYVKIRRVVMVEGRSEREVAHYFGIHRKIVKKMCQYAAPLGYRRKGEPVSPKLAPFTGIINVICCNTGYQRNHPHPANPEHHTQDMHHSGQNKIIHYCLLF
jgi:hypothetical protein